MNDVSFDSTLKRFHCTTKESDKIVEFEFDFKQEYHPNIDCEQYNVELLINPFLNRESNIFRLQSRKQNVGYIFPVNVFDSEETLENDFRGISRHIFAAFSILLRRLQKVTSSNFSDNFEENICVFVIDKNRLGIDNPLYKCIHSLRKWGYSFFEENNTVREVRHYDNRFYIRNTRINLEFTSPVLYEHDTIKYLLREYPKTTSPIHRFIILYQIIEYLFDVEARHEAAIIIEKYNSNLLMYNDLSTDLRALTSEKNKINKIFNRCGALSSFQTFEDRYSDLCRELFYEPNCEGTAEMFYSFRNLLTHSYRLPHSREKKLNLTIQAAELLILEIVENYKI